MPSYRIKKEKRDLKKVSDTPKQDSSSSSLIDPSSVTVVGAVDGQGILQSPGSSSGKKKKSNPSEKVKAHSSKDLKTGTDKPSKSPSAKPHRSSADSRIDELDQGPVSRSLLKIKVTLNSRISLTFSLL